MSRDAEPRALQYSWPTNLTEYEAKVFAGLTAVEAIGAGLGFLIPLATIQSISGLFVGIAAAAMVLLCIKRLDNLGGMALPVYLARRAWEARRSESLELPLIMGGESGRVEIESWEGETLMVLGEGGEHGHRAAGTV